MNKINLNDIPLEDSHGEAQVKRVLIRKEDNTGNIIFMNEVYLEPGSEFPSHAHEDLIETFYILEGSGVMIIDDKEEPVKQGDRVIVSTKESHSMKNTGNQTIKFICFAIKV